jgi:7-keto-8-aminopelargonate synthetase-like enzyme
MFSASLAPPNTAAALAALGIVEREPERRLRVLETAATVRTGLQGIGFRVLSGHAAVVAVAVADPADAFALYSALLDAGVYVNPVIPPAVTTSLLRISCMATHEPGDVDRLLEAMHGAGRRLGIVA